MDISNTNKSMESSRRTFIKKSVFASTALISPANNLFKDLILNESVPNNKMNISLFSKALQFLDYKSMSEAIKEMGFDGIDLTIRPKGHVLPESVEVDLPKATEAMRSIGLMPNLFTTNIKDPHSPIDKKVLEVSSDLGYKTYRTAWIKYKSDKDILETVAYAQKQLTDLAQLNKRLKLTGGYQNHSGHYFGSGIWDLHGVIEEIPSNQIGCQYDITHASIEGGRNWEIGFNLIKSYINSIVLKDYLWTKNNGKWKVKYVPLGEGMVDFKRFFSLLKQSGINVPFSIHVEYDLGGAERGKNPRISHKEIFKIIRKDLNFARQTNANAQ